MYIFTVDKTDRNYKNVETPTSFRKKIRLDNFTKPKLKIRSVYDHIESVAHLADCLLPVLKHNLTNQDACEIARCIAYHELNEVVLGDIPVYTNLSVRKRRSARIYAEQRLRSIDAASREKIANDFVGMFLNSKQRESLETVSDLMGNRDSAVYRFFKLVDKIDPIFAIWRYLHVHRGQFVGGAEQFLKETRDFFENSDVKKVAKDYTQDPRVYALVVRLQDRKDALNYYKDRQSILAQKSMFGIPNEIVANAIEGRLITFVEAGPI
jgi:5'-deoxynucleotidase YfbR-like HD superfamily hydrolase